MKDIMKLIALLSVILVISACSNNESSQVIEPSKPVDVEVVEEKPEELEEVTYPFTNPLTGIGTEEQVDHRVVGVTINNHPAARPQSGLIDADIVYEVLAEGEMTRFVALFHSELPKNIGPVRSARPYLIDLVNGYNGVLVTHGWSPEAEQLLKSGRADYLNGLFYDGTLFKRSSDRKAPHNSYISSDNIKEGMKERGYELSDEVPPLLFRENEVNTLSGIDSKKIEINYSNRNYVQYEFDEKSGYYERFNGEDQTVDYETNEPIQIANLFIVEAKHQVLDDVGRRAIDLDSGGDALLFQDGVASTVKWERRDGRIVPVLNGELVPLKSGQTWINIVPTSPGLESSVTYRDEEEVSGGANQ